MVAKAGLILAYPLIPQPAGYTLAIKWDPVGIAFANWVVSALYPRGIARPEMFPFDIALVAAFGIECLVVGLVVRWLVRKQARST